MQKWMRQNIKSLLMLILIVATLAVIITMQQKYSKNDSQLEQPSDTAITDVTEETPVGQKESIVNEETWQEFDGTFQYFRNGDSFYTPGKNHAVTDANSSVLYYDNLLLAFTDSDLSQEEMDRISQMVGGQTMGVVSGGIHAFQILVEEAVLTELEAQADALMNQPQVLYACCEYPVQIMSNGADDNPWDPDGLEESLGNEEAPDGLDWWAEAIGAYTAWAYTGFCQKVRIGIVDNGFAADHEDLRERITFVTKDENNTAANHGTMVAGILGATNNEVGIRGVADTAELYCADLWPTDDPNTYHTMTEYLAVINDMAQNGVKVVNNSWGCLTPSEDTWQSSWNCYKGDYQQFMEQRLNQDLIPTAEYCIVMISQLISSGYEDIIHVQAAGNDSVDARYGGFFCSVTDEIYNGMDAALRQKLEIAEISYKDIKERILIVGSVENTRDPHGNYSMAYFTNYGSTVDICAPGHVIFTTMSYSNNSYGAEGGTSLSAPMVTGSIGFLWALDPTLTVEEIRQILLDSSPVQAVGAGNSQGWTCPMLNIGTAVEKLLD